MKSATSESPATRSRGSRAFFVLFLVLPFAAILLAGEVRPPCWFHELTGLYCPGCGSGRALTALTRGDLLAAFDFNPLLPALLPLLGYEALRRTLAREQNWKDVLAMPRVTWALAVTVIAFGILRNLPFSPFRWLAPGGM